MKITIKLTDPRYTKRGKESLEKLGFVFSVNNLGYFVPEKDEIALNIDADYELIEVLGKYLD